MQLYITITRRPRKRRRPARSSGHWVRQLALVLAHIVRLGVEEARMAAHAVQKGIQVVRTALQGAEVSASGILSISGGCWNGRGPDVFHLTPH